ncbi:MAG: ribosome maturation factor RimP [Candidatus Goldiibacteriota bacterium]|jgi:ribosome maturation factor RimP
MTDLNGIKERIEALIEPVIKANSFELVDLEIAGPNYLRIRVDRPQGLNLDDCAAISRKIEESLDASDIIGDKYFLEVSSPGINRPLKKKEHFTAFAGRRIKIVTREKLNGTHSFGGILKGMNGDSVQIEENGTITEIAYDIIKKANIDEEVF